MQFRVLDRIDYAMSPTHGGVAAGDAPSHAVEEDCTSGEARERAEHRLLHRDRLRRALSYWNPDPKRRQDAGIVMMGAELPDRWIGCPSVAALPEIRRVFSYLDWPKGWKSEPRSG